jgi:hypothetical protein
MRLSAIFLKFDIARAFDSVSRPLLLEVLRAHGFGKLWCAWIISILFSSSSKVLINGHPTERVWHIRELRKGDPLSPMLFVIVMDVLAALFKKAEDLNLFETLTSFGVKFRLSLFADDVALVVRPHLEEICLAKEIFHLLGDASGLWVNYDKSVTTRIRCNMVEVDPIITLLSCPTVEFPRIYLGLPLSSTHLPRSHLRPYREKLARRLPTWKGGLMDLAGRLILVKAVLTAMSIYIMMVLDLPVWMLNDLEKNCRGFLWCAKDSAKGGACPIAWAEVCASTAYGSMGIRKLHILNDALWMKWLWMCRTSVDRIIDISPVPMLKNLHCYVKSLYRSGGREWFLFPFLGRQMDPRV